MAFETMDSQMVFKGRVFNVRVDQILLPDGTQFRLDVVEHRNAVTMLPIDEEGNIWFVRQYRHPVGKELLELPAGVMGESEDPEFAAQRELREEIGMAPSTLKKLGEFFLAPGYSTEYMYIYLAEGLKPDALIPDKDEFIQIVKVPSDQALELILSGQVCDAKSLVALMFWMIDSHK